MNDHVAQWSINKILPSFCLWSPSSYFSVALSLLSMAAKVMKKATVYFCHCHWRAQSQFHFRWSHRVHLETSSWYLLLQTFSRTAEVEHWTPGHSQDTAASWWIHIGVMRLSEVNSVVYCCGMMLPNNYYLRVDGLNADTLHNGTKWPSISLHDYNYFLSDFFKPCIVVYNFAQCM